MRLRSLLPSCFATLLILGMATVAVAAAPGATGCQKVPGTPVVQNGFLFLAAGGGIEPPSTQSVCNALCQDGSYVSCYGTSCTAVDASCPSQRGYCTGTSTGTRYCPVCTCSATASCPDGSTVSCTGTGSTCFAINGCYASCNGVLHWCANPKGPCPIEAGP